MLGFIFFIPYILYILYVVYVINSPSKDETRLCKRVSFFIYTMLIFFLPLPQFFR